MKVGIIFLGNPGLKYKYTRHNYGFLLFEEIINSKIYPLLKHELMFTQDDRYNHQDMMVYSTHIINQRQCFLLKTTAGINITGLILKKYNINFDINIILSDDVYINFKQLKLNRKKTHCGHNGLKSIFNVWDKNYNTFVYRLGIGPQTCLDLDKFVLSNFNHKELSFIQKQASECVKIMISHIFLSDDKNKMITAIMNSCNKRHEE